jgi:hypothetical protein
MSIDFLQKIHTSSFRFPFLISSLSLSSGLSLLPGYLLFTSFSLSVHGIPTVSQRLLGRPRRHEPVTIHFLMHTSGFSDMPPLLRFGILYLCLICKVRTPVKQQEVREKNRKQIAFTSAKFLRIRQRTGKKSQDADKEESID